MAQDTERKPARSRAEGPARRAPDRKAQPASRGAKRARPAPDAEPAEARADAAPGTEASLDAPFGTRTWDDRAG